MLSLEGIFNTDINYPGIEIKIELIVMREYLAQIETGVNAVCKNYIEEEESKHSDKEYFEYQYIYQIAEDEIPRLIRMPFLITIYTLFEDSVSRLLNYAQEKEEKALSLKDINGKSLPQIYNKYMAHVLGYDFQFSAHTLSEISIINKIRNLIAHANGNLESLSDDKLKVAKDIAKKNIGVTAEYGKLDISYQFLEHSLHIISEGIESLMKYMEKKYGFY